MKIVGIKLLYGTFVQLIAVIILYEFFRRYAISHGGIGGSGALSNIHPLIWLVLLIEFVFAIVVMNKKDKSQS